MEYKSETKICQNCKKDFTIEPEDFSFYEKIKVPPPTFCPECRAERRFCFRNEIKLFKAIDAFTNKEIFSLYPNQGNRKIITGEEWHSDTWDAMDYGVDYDFSCSFFEQFSDLEKKIPVLALRFQNMVNSSYCANANGLKNCYLCFASSHSENCMYSLNVDFSKDSIDNSHMNHSERCYECFWMENCYQCYFSILCKESYNLFFSKNCIDCSNCVGCVNLVKKQYCIFNKQYTKEEYEKEIEQMRLDSRSGVSKMKETTDKFWKIFPVKNHQGLKNINSSGSYVTNSKNVNDSYFIREGEDMRYCQYMPIPKNKDCYDANNWGANMELHYESCLCGDNSYNVRFCCNCWPSCKNIEYSMHLFSCSDCFGCVGLKKKQYCIFNKQYTKEDYEILVEKIKKQMDEIPFIDKVGRVYKYGEFFPIQFSVFGYNNTLAMQHFSMTEEEANKNGYPWFKIEKGKYNISKRAEELSDSIDDVDDSILQDIIECKNCKNAYRILENELVFYKKEKIPLPEFCSECRHKNRIENRLKLKLYSRKCMCAGDGDVTKKYKNSSSHFHGKDVCSEKFKTGYDIDSADIVYCEKCYQAEVY